MTNHSFRARKRRPRGICQFAVVDDRAGFGGLIAQVFGQYAESLDQGSPVGDKETIAIKVGEHPLVGIEAVAVSQFDPVLDVTELGADGGSACHGSVYVQPEPLPGGKFGRSLAAGRGR